MTLETSISDISKDASSMSVHPATYVKEIDALRAFAAFAVILQHCSLLPFGWMGVWLFFVISGFAITSSLSNSILKATISSRPVLNFFLRRSIRIWPVYFLYLALCAPFLITLGDTRVFSNYLYLGTFVFNLRMIGEQAWSAFPVDGILGHLWTISVEEQFYVLFPFLFVFLRPVRFKQVLLALVVFGPLIRYLVSLLLSSLELTDGHRAFSIYALSFTHFDAFAMGALIALNRNFFERNLTVARQIFGLGLVVAAIYCAVYVALNFTNGARGTDLFRNVISGIMWGQGREVFVYSAVTITASGLITLILAREKTMLCICNIPYLQHLGRISYGIYLYHALVLFLVSQLLATLGFGDSILENILRFLIVAVLTVCVAQISFKYFEKPILKLRKHFP